MKNKITIRKEKYGIILYSTKLRNYISFNSRELEQAVIQIAHKKKKVIDYANNDMFLECFNSLGINELSDTVYEIKDCRKKQIPLEIYYDYTNACNLKCTHCYNRMVLNQNTMNNNQIKMIINDMAKLGIRRIHLAGGEPLLFPENLDTYLNSAQENSIITSIATNGLLLTESMCHKLIEGELLSVSVSIDGYDEKTNSLYRGRNAFAKACNGVKKMVKAKAESNSNIEVCLKPTYYTETSYDYFEKCILLAIDLGVDKIKFANPERCEYHEKGYYGKLRSKYYECAKHIHALKQQYGEKIKITEINNPVVNPSIIGLEGRKGCIGAQELLAINPNGDITPCLMNKTILGNYYNYDSLEEFLYTNEVLEIYRNSMISDKCQDCENYRYCRGGCQVRKKVEYGVIQFKDPLCVKDTDVKLEDNEFPFRMINVLHSL